MRFQLVNMRVSGGAGLLSFDVLMEAVVFHWCV
jgi:hypothetical protein